MGDLFWPRTAINGVQLNCLSSTKVKGEWSLTKAFIPGRMEHRIESALSRKLHKPKWERLRLPASSVIYSTAVTQLDGLTFILNDIWAIFISHWPLHVSVSHCQRKWKARWQGMALVELNTKFRLAVAPMFAPGILIRGLASCYLSILITSFLFACYEACFITCKTRNSENYFAKQDTSKEVYMSRPRKANV